MKTLFAAIALAGIALSAAASHAGPAPSQTLKVADLDLSHPGDVTKLARRITRAAAEVCAVKQGDAAPSAYAEARECRVRATREAVEAIGHPALTARFETETYALLKLGKGPSFGR
jgi:UrcA family protein